MTIIIKTPITIGTIITHAGIESSLDGGDIDDIPLIVTCDKAH